MQDKVVYTEGSEIRAIRGELQDAADSDFIILKRESGTLRINKRFIIKIEEGSE